MGTNCRLTGGSWWSYYQAWVTAASGLDIDHMVPLAESWDSGASGWTAQRREAYAYAQGAATSLVAITARSNRSKADQDPAQWLPPAAEAHCRYVAEWAATKLRWSLAADEAEVAALREVAVGCPEQTVTYEPAVQGPAPRGSARQRQGGPRRRDAPGREGRARQRSIGA
ncbi:hypothetical protein GCM10010103_79070 [Streptomyces paradoxus]|uniref:GmrSD restriction endonucleases C-terminal domain-containing protein n=1 Tax=Streptomyces paradoxus TaxID=66375 RepID=A0A7W9TI60_9ACTN|nr:hypothetical protein [Streptomyces paradoxus]